MRLLPRSAKGTWLLATAVWVALIATVWPLIPLRPRTAWPARPSTGIIGFVPNSRVFVSYTRPTGNHDSQWQTATGPIEFRDIDTGRSWSVLSSNDPVTMTELSGDGRLILVRIGNQMAQIRIFDIASGKSKAELPLDDPSGGERATFSPDGRWLAYSDRREKTGVRIWNAVENRECAAPIGALWPCAFSPNSGLLAYGVGRRFDATRIALWDIESQRMLKELELPPKFACYELHFSPDGTTLATCLDTTRPIQGRAPDLLIHGWDTGTGVERFRISHYETMFFPKLAHWFGLCGRDRFRRFDCTTGAQCGEFVVYRENSAEIWGTGVSPDGRYLAVESLIYNPMLLWLNRHWLHRPENEFVSEHLKLLDAHTGSTVAILPARFDWQRRDGMERTQYAPDGSLMALMTDSEIEIWDIPPCKSLAWFSIAAAILALPIAGLARRRVRRLRKKAA